jgi:hypothetical protein
MGDIMGARELIQSIKDHCESNDIDYVDLIWNEREVAQEVKMPLRFEDWWQNHKKRDWSVKNK